MRPTFRKLEVKDIGNLEQLVAENVEGIEPGLKVVDSRLLLGQAAIDLVGLDLKGSLVLIALDFSAHEGLLLRVMDAYSWCLEYPDTIRRLYPMAQVSPSRPPRILFIVERLTDSFVRRIKQLSFLEIDCFEFRHLEVNGASIVYFDLVERLRKSVGEPAVNAPEATAPAVVIATQPSVEPVSPAVVESVRVESHAAAEPVWVEPRKAAVAQPLRVEPKIPVAVEPERIEPPIPVVLSAPAPVAEPVPVVMQAPPVMLERESVPFAAEPAAALSPVPEPETAEPIPPPPALALQAIEATASLAAVDSGTIANGQQSRAVFDQTVIEPAINEIVVVPAEIPAPVSVPVAETVPVDAPAGPVVPTEPQIAPAPAPTPPVWAKPQTPPNGGRPYFFAQATKTPSPVEAPAVATAVAAPIEQPAQTVANKVGVAVDDRPELESLSFPKDGLSRQWLEFLSQLGATK